VCKRANVSWQSGWSPVYIVQVCGPSGPTRSVQSARSPPANKLKPAGSGREIIISLPGNKGESLRFPSGAANSCAKLGRLICANLRALRAAKEGGEFEWPSGPKAEAVGLQGERAEPSAWRPPTASSPGQLKTCHGRPTGILVPFAAWRLDSVRAHRVGPRAGRRRAPLGAPAARVRAKPLPPAGGRSSAPAGRSTRRRLHRSTNGTLERKLEAAVALHAPPALEANQESRMKRTRILINPNLSPPLEGASFASECVSGSPIGHLFMSSDSLSRGGGGGGGCGGRASAG